MVKANPQGVGGMGATDYISEQEPLPGPEIPKGRWANPYISDSTGRLTVYTRRPLEPMHASFGLRSCLSADTFERLKELIEEENEKWTAFHTRPTFHQSTG